MLKASKGVGTSETGRAAIEGLSLYFQRIPKLSHAFRKAVASLFVGTEVLNLASQCGVVLMEDSPVHTSG